MKVVSAWNPDHEATTAGVFIPDFLEVSVTYIFLYLLDMYL
jgi:hypothetical protein